MVLIVSVLLFCLISCVISFNVDIDNPIVFKGPRNSYFGYSVAILENSKGTWLLVGAPRANDSILLGVTEPGVVFQCNWQYSNSCKPVYIDNIGNERQVFIKWKNVTVQHNKNNQWLGASLDVNVHGDSQIMICAPRWADHKFYVQGFQLMNGLCYESNRDLQFDRSSAWPALENWQKQVHAAGYYSYGMGNLGTSTSYSRDGTFSVLGAPGLNDWSGGFAYIKKTNTTSEPRIIELSAEMNSDSYFGMSITTAALSADGVSIVIGGPRAGVYGKVYVYNSEFQVLLAKEGSQLGSSFGASVCAVDLNGDGLDDLAVGAPLYSETLDEGRVYVYINKEFVSTNASYYSQNGIIDISTQFLSANFVQVWTFNLELMQPLLEGSNAAGARFGTAIANIGDINLDHFEDIAIGAPYEDEAGVVYIYNGAKSGLHQEYSQRIVAKNLGIDLKAFGCSFSRPWDVDGNHYKDFAVGSFVSDHVVLLRTRPVLDLHASLQVSSPVVDLSSEPKCAYNGQPWHCLEVSVCLSYSGQDLPSSADVNITLWLDTLERHRGERTRMFFTGETHTEMESITEVVTVRLDYETCPRKYTVFIRKSRDVMTPLMLELEYDINYNSLGSSNMDTIRHVKNRYMPTSSTYLVSFDLHCGNDRVCTPNFDIQATPLFNNGNQYLVIDDTPFFELEIVVSNIGEVSYLTVLTIDYPPSIYYATVTEGTTIVSCAPASKMSDATLASLNCNIMAPFKSGDKVVLIARFNARGIPYDVHTFDMKTKVSSVVHSNGTSIGEKAFFTTIPIQTEADIRLYGVSIPGQLTLPREHFLSDNDTEWSNVSHLYILRNQGPSTMPHSELTLTLPAVAWLKMITMQIESKTATITSSHVPVECSMPTYHSEGHLSQTNKTGSNSHLGDISVYSLNCDSALCSNVTCYIGFFHKYETVYINISFAVRTNVLDILKVDNHLKFLSAGDYVSDNLLTSYVTTTTYIKYKAFPKRIITWWMLTISASSGLLILYILSLMLWKCGFFRRKHREELQLLITSSEAEQELIRSDSYSATSSDIMDFSPNHSLSSTIHGHYDQNDAVLLTFPNLDPDNFFFGQSFNRQKSFQNDSQGREDMNPELPQFVSFQSLQLKNQQVNNQRDITFHNSLYGNSHKA